MFHLDSEMQFMMNRLLLIGIVTFVYYLSKEVVECKINFYSYETRSNTINDGRKVVTKIEESRSDSDKSQHQQTKQQVFVRPSKYHSQGNTIAQRQVATNNIGVGLDLPLSKPLKSFINVYGGKPAQLMSGRGRTRGFITRARNVESPAYSVDSGGKASGSSISGGIAKLFNVKQGFYSDVYDKIDRPELLSSTTMRPTDDIAIENAVRHAVDRIISERNKSSRA